MPSHTVSLYSLEVRRRVGRSYELVPLGDIDDGRDFVVWFRDLLKSWIIDSDTEVDAVEAIAEEQEVNSSHLNDEEEQKLLLVRDKTIESTNRRAGAILLTGAYGPVKDIIDQQTGRKVGTVLRNHSVVSPVYVTGVFPSDASEGFMCFQRFMGNGVFALLKKHLTQRFAADFEGHSLNIRAVVTQEQIREIVRRGGIQMLTFFKRRGNETRVYGDGETRTMILGEDYFESYAIGAAPRRSWLPLQRDILSFLDGDNTLNKYLPFEDFDYDLITTKVAIGGKSRILRLLRDGGTTAAFDAEGVVSINNQTGMPDWAELRRFCTQILDDQLNGTGN